MRYDAFISYSRAANGRLAPAIQRALHSLARPWHKRRALSVFCDVTNLSVTPELWPSIERTLNHSKALVLLASPEAAKSKWVNREVAHWRAKLSARPIYLVLTSGDIVWNDDHGDFDVERSTAIPPALAGAYATEPAWVDLRWGLTEIDLSLKNPRCADAMATLAAPLHGCDKDVLIGEDVRQHNRTRRMVALTMATVLTLLVVAAVSAVVARQQLLRATAGLANTLALSAVTNNAGRDTPLLAAIGASRLTDTSETRAALIQLVQRNQHVARFLYPPDRTWGVVALAVSRRGQVAAKTYSGPAQLWDAQGARRTIDTKELVSPLFAFADERLLILGTDGQSLVLVDGDRTQTLDEVSQEFYSGPSTPTPVFAANATGAVIAYAIASYGASSTLTVCRRAPSLACRSIDEKTHPRALAITDDGSRVAVALRNGNAGTLSILKTADLTTEGETPINGEQPVGVSADGNTLQVLTDAGREHVFPAQARARDDSMALPQARFANETISVYAGRFSAWADALEGVGVPEVDSTIVVIERTATANGRLVERLVRAPRGANTGAPSGPGAVEDELPDPTARSADGMLSATVENTIGEGAAPKVIVTNRKGSSFSLSTDYQRIRALAIGTRFLAAASDYKIFLWYRESGHRATPPFSAPDGVTLMDFTADDNRLIVHQGNGVADAIILAPLDLQRLACSMVGRDLDRDEWRTAMSSVEYERSCEAVMGRALPDPWPTAGDRQPATAPKTGS